MGEITSVYPAILSGLILGMFAGVFGILARRLSSRRMPMVAALIVGMLVGGTAGALAAGSGRGQDGKGALALTACVAGAMMPLATTLRFFKTDEAADAAPSATTESMTSR